MIDSPITLEVAVNNMTTLIAGFDIATTVGVAYGRPDDVPKLLTWNLRNAGKSRPYRLAALADHCFAFFGEVSPDMLFYEQGLSIGAAYQIGMNEGTVAMLRGAIGVVEAVAAKSKIPVIRAVSVQDARKHLLGKGHIPKGEGKHLVFDRCKALRWPVTNEDESDAAAIFSYGCALANPRIGHLVTPLFSGASQ